MACCNICADSYTGVLRKPIKCNNCNFICCLKCFKKYITTTETALKCMSCKIIFDIKFLKENLSTNYIKTTIRKLEEEIIFEKEKKHLITTQRELDLQKKQDEISGIINEQKKELNKISTSDDLNYAIQESLIFKLEKSIKELSFNYIKKCGNTHCNGMLSDENTVNNNYICTICDSITCSECEVILSKTKHVCDKNLLENLKTLKEETKPCPTCLSRIYKSEGCSQMYCIQCFTVFDWNTGKIDTGKIHNPHYIASFKYYNRDPLDIQCGRELEYAFWDDVTHNYNTLIRDVRFNNYFCAFYNSRSYITKKIKNFTNEISINRDIRIKFLNGKINENKYKKLCLENIQNAEIEKKLLDIVITFMNCGNEIFFKMFHLWDNETKDLTDYRYHIFDQEFENFINLCNVEFNKISIIKKDLYNLRYGVNSF